MRGGMRIQRKREGREGEKERQERVGEQNEGRTDKDLDP